MVADQAMDYPQKRGDGIQFKNKKLRIQLGKELLDLGASKSIKDNYGNRPVDLTADKELISLMDDSDNQDGCEDKSDEFRRNTLGYIEDLKKYIEEKTNLENEPKIYLKDIPSSLFRHALKSQEVSIR